MDRFLYSTTCVHSPIHSYKHYFLHLSAFYQEFSLTHTSEGSLGFRTPDRATAAEGRVPEKQTALEVSHLLDLLALLIDHLFLTAASFGIKVLCPVESLQSDMYYLSRTRGQT